MRRNPLGFLGVGILLCFVLMAIFAPILPRLSEIYDPVQGMDPEILGTSSPSGRHLLGTDAWGGDILSQLMHGARTALLVAVVAAATSVAIGTLIGLVAGYFAGLVDGTLMRLVDVMLTLPLIPLVLVVSSALGQLSIWGVVLLIGFLGWPGIARVIRAQALSLRTRDFIESARAYGAGNVRIILRHMAPSVLPLAFVYMSLTANGAIFLEAALSFLGLGDPNTVSWGMMLQWCFKTGNTFRAPYWMLPPGLSISALCFSFYLIGRGLDEVVNPKLRRM
ncbi:MAG TPA: ABC transporter permease [Candidatus Heimdallarchaeota archaeon]|nr:ABC transporter permease [Candidatus Heimdallarchaeota archaeon]